MNFTEIFNKIEGSLKGNTHLEDLVKKKYDPFKILISTILSARTRDENTRKVTNRLFKKYNKPSQIANTTIEELEDLVYESGFYKIKAARIKEVSKIIQNKYNGEIPADFNKLIELPGVGRKTANCVLVYAFRIPAICVDTHVHRISNRIGWVHTNNPKFTEISLKKLIPKDEWIRINRLFVMFGQQICLPINPKHNICPIENICLKDLSMEKRKKKVLKKKTTIIK